MLSSKSPRRSSRRSSILKPCKSHPQQNVNWNNSPNESSSTTNKIKRRVSFAEKKQVKEFCNSLEKGTVWDNTYEEHDLSYPNLSCNSNQHKCQTRNGKTENMLDGRIEEYAGPFINKVTGKDLNVEDCVINVENVAKDAQHQDQLYCPVKIPVDSNTVQQNIAYEEKDEKCPKKILQLAESNVNIVECNESNRTYLQDSCMDFTEVVCNNDNYIYSTESDKVSKNESMTLTQAVLPVFSAQQFTNNVAEEHESIKLTNPLVSVIRSDEPNTLGTACCINDTVKESDISLTNGIEPHIQINFNESCSKNNGTAIIHNVSMEITKAVKTNICKAYDRSTALQTAVEDKYHGIKCSETTKLLNMSMEVTQPVSIDVHPATEKHQKYEINCDVMCCKKSKYDRDASVLTKNSDETRICNDEGMEFTEAVLNSSIPQTDVVTLTVNSPNLDRSILNNCGNDNVNKTTIYHDSSMTMTKVMPTLSVVNHQELSRTTVFPNTSMEITNVAPTLQLHPQGDSNLIKEPVLSESMKSIYLTKDSSFRLNIQSNDDSITAAPSILEIDSISKKENNTFKSPDVNAEEFTQIEIQPFSNNKPSMALYESVCQNTIPASTVEIKNAQNVSLSNNVVQLSENECLQNTMSHLCRTYTIQSSNNDQSFAIDHEKSNNNSAMENDSSIFPTQNLEVLDSIDPPSYLYSDNSIQKDTSVNVNQKIATDENCILRNENIECEVPSICNLANVDQKDLTNEYIRKSQTFLVNSAFPKHLPDNLQIEQEKQINTVEIETLQLLELKSSRTDITILNHSRPEECSKADFEGNQTKLCLDKNDGKCQSMECISLDVEKILKTKDTDKPIDVNMKEATNKQLKRNLESNSLSSTESVSAEIDSFSTLSTEFKMLSKSDDIIWDVYYESVQKNMLVIGFISCSLLVVIYFHDICETWSKPYLKDIKIISRLADDADLLISLIHRIILERLDTKSLLNSYKYRADIFPMLNHISEEVKLAMNFMFELKRLNNINLMEITRESISFVSQTKRKDIILKITIDVKPFEKIEAQNISVHCLLGSVKEEDIKKLITNIKRDHKFLRRYINDVRDYMYLMEETGIVEPLH